MEYKDYYKILGVERDATQDDIKKAYRKLARKYHPDVSKEADAEDRFKEMHEAYEVLKDPEKRAAYDRLGARWQEGEEFRPPPDWDTGFEFSGGGFTDADAEQFSDFFESLFGGGGPFAGFHDRTGGGGFRMRGQDHHAKVQIRLEDAFHGTSREIHLDVPEVDAAGRVTTRQRTLRVRIPSGITEGRQIRLAGQGGAGVEGGPAGDLYLEIEFAPHPLFHADGKDIHVNLPIAPWEAALGGQVKVPTLGGSVDMKVPAGSRSGQRLRLKGRGLPGSPPGDQYVVLQVVVPPAKTDEDRKLYEQMKEKMSFNPRERMGA
ncbi:MAG TPA: DnaJ C-terminal domain-containing protein [Gammaproteobacteria bacterium]|nr:DnaJ C-terminal domain-containing protein [Gammaproteobacteria bacterium]